MDYFPLDQQGQPTKVDDKHYITNQQEAISIAEHIGCHRNCLI